MNPFVQQRIRTALNLTDKQSLIPQDLLKVKNLSFADSLIGDLTGLELCINIEQLNLHRSIPRDLTFLRRFPKLFNLDLSTNGLKEIDILKNVPSLTHLNLADNMIRNISPLAALTDLEFLNLQENITPNLESIRRLVHLKSLHLGKYSENEVGAHTAELYGNPYWEYISNIEPLRDLIQLEELSIWDDGITDLSPLSNCTHLKKLELGGMVGDARLSDLNPIANLTQLEKLIIIGKSIADLTPLKYLAHLQYLCLDDNHIRDLQPLLDRDWPQQRVKIQLLRNKISDETRIHQIPLLRKKNVEVFVDDPPKRRK